MRAGARLIAVLGAAGVGLFLFKAAPHDVVLVYDLSRDPGATSVDVELRRGGEVVRHAELAVPASGQVRHRVRLTNGDYELSFRASGTGAEVRGVRPLDIHEGGTIVVPLGP